MVLPTSSPHRVGLLAGICWTKRQGPGYSPGLRVRALVTTLHSRNIPCNTLSNVDDGETVPTPVTTVLSLQNLMDANKFLVFFNSI